MRRLVVAGALAALALPSSALAHASVTSLSPDYAQRVARAPAEVRLGFDQAVTLPIVRVYSKHGPVALAPARIDRSGRTIVARFPHVLPAGGYTIRWQALSADGHVVSGVYTFGIRVAAPPITGAFGASGPTVTEKVVRWGYFFCLALLTGGLGFVLLCRPELPPRALNRFYLVTGIGVAGALEIGIVGFLLRAEDALQLPFERLLYGDLAPVAGTRFGLAFIAMTLGFALTAAFVYLAWLTDRRWLLWPAFFLAAAFLSGLSLSGHDAVDPGSSWVSAFADWVHLLAACLWLGGLIQLLAVVWPAAPGARRDAFLRFSRLAGVAMALVLLAGTYLSVVRLERLSDLWQTGYGQVLLAKIALVLVALGFGAFHHTVVRPALERSGRSEGVRRSLLGESLVGMAVLLAAAFLVNAKPPARAQSPSRAAGLAGTLR